MHLVLSELSTWSCLRYAGNACCGGQRNGGSSSYKWHMVRRHVVSGIVW